MDDLIQGKPKRKRGRPPGSKTKAKLAEREDLPRSKPGRAKTVPVPRDRTRCICGRNLLYPLRETPATVTCRCNRIHKKKNVLGGETVIIVHGRQIQATLYIPAGGWG